MRLQTLKSSVRGRANVPSTSLISVQSSLDLNSWRYLESKNSFFIIFRTEIVSIWNLIFRKWRVYLLKRECAVRRTPLMMWKSPLLKRVTISVRRSGHFWGKSSLPMMLMASLSCTGTSSTKTTITQITAEVQIRLDCQLRQQVIIYLFLNLFWAAQHQIYNVCFDRCSVSIWDFVWFIFNLGETNQIILFTNICKDMFWTTCFNGY